MIRTLSDSAIFIDSSAVIALKNPSDQFHDSANNYFELVQGVRWVVMNSTTHETYTRIRYDDSLKLALEVYDWLKSPKFHNIPFEAKDEDQAREILEEYRDHTFSYHDALCAAVMLRIGLFRIFSFDKHFWILGFQVELGNTL